VSSTSSAVRSLERSSNESLRPPDPSDMGGAGRGGGVAPT
jgi:hypothetical protein